MAMQEVIFVGIQAIGKSTFYLRRFFRTHVRINLDMLRTRHRERLMIQACLDAKQPFVVDNTNPTLADRERYIGAAKAADFKVIGYYFRSDVDAALARNSGRPEEEQVPEKAILGTYKRLGIPTMQEGFDQLFYVRTGEGGQFVVEEWRDEV
jgi:predicted kinase